jgi:hypothetical protein
VLVKCFQGEDNDADDRQDQAMPDCMDPVVALDAAAQEAESEEQSDAAPDGSIDGPRGADDAESSEHEEHERRHDA